MYYFSQIKTNINTQQKNADFRYKATYQRFKCFTFSFKTFSVELEGVEPSSKQGSHMLSTCLSLPSVFVYRQACTLVPKTSFRLRDYAGTIPEFAAPLDQTLRNKSF